MSLTLSLLLVMIAVSDLRPMRPQTQFASAPSGDGHGQPRVNFRQADALSLTHMEIPLMNGGTALIDDMDYAKVNAYQWRWVRAGTAEWAV